MNKNVKKADMGDRRHSVPDLGIHPVRRREHRAAGGSPRVGKIRSSYVRRRDLGIAIDSSRQRRLS